MGVKKEKKLVNRQRTKGVRKIILRKEVIQPHLLIRLPCYDLTPVTDNTLGVCLHCWLTRRLKVQPTSMVWRAVCTRPENVFTATCWYAITSDSDFMLSSCRKQSVLRLQLEFDFKKSISLRQPLYYVCSPACKGHEDLTSSPPSSCLTQAVQI